MDLSTDLLSLVQETRKLIHQNWPEPSLKIRVSKPTPALVEKPVQKVLEPTKVDVKTKIQKPIPVLELSAVKQAFLSVRPKARLLEKPLADTVAQEKKNHWRKSVETQDLLLLFSKSCHPLLFDIENAINTHLMSAALISLEELSKLSAIKARVILFEKGIVVDALKAQFPKTQFVEIPEASLMAGNPELKKKVWATLKQL